MNHPSTLFCPERAASQRRALFLVFAAYHCIPISGDVQRGIFTKIPAGNPVKTPSHAVNSKPTAFIGCWEF
jgi:hypothetical protein